MKKKLVLTLGGMVVILWHIGAGAGGNSGRQYKPQQRQNTVCIDEQKMRELRLKNAYIALLNLIVEIVPGERVGAKFEKKHGYEYTSFCGKITCGYQQIDSSSINSILKDITNDGDADRTGFLEFLWTLQEYEWLRKCFDHSM